MPDPMSLAAALDILAGTGRVRIIRIQCELAALNRVRAELEARAARITELEAQPRLVPVNETEDDW